MAAFVDYGNAEAAAAEIIRESTEVAAEVDDYTVSTDLIGYTAATPWVRVWRSGGTPTHWMRLDRPEVSVEVRGPDKGTALALAAAARSALFAAQGQYSGNGLALYDVTDVEGLAWDPEEASPRYTFAVRMITRPA